MTNQAACPPPPSRCDPGTCRLHSKQPRCSSPHQLQHDPAALLHRHAQASAQTPISANTSHTQSAAKATAAPLRPGCTGGSPAAP